MEWFTCAQSRRMLDPENLHRVVTVLKIVANMVADVRVTVSVKAGPSSIARFSSTFSKKALDYLLTSDILKA